MHFMVLKQAIFQENSSKKLEFSCWLKFPFCPRGKLSQKFLSFCKTQSYLKAEDNLYRNIPVCQHLSSTCGSEIRQTITSAGLEEKDGFSGPGCPFTDTTKDAVGHLQPQGHTYRTYFHLLSTWTLTSFLCRTGSSVKQTVKSVCASAEPKL